MNGLMGIMCHGLGGLRGTETCEQMKAKADLMLVAAKTRSKASHRKAAAQAAEKKMKEYDACIAQRNAAQALALQQAQAAAAQAASSASQASQAATAVAEVVATAAPVVAAVTPTAPVAAVDSGISTQAAVAATSTESPATTPLATETPVNGQETAPQGGGSGGTWVLLAGLAVAAAIGWYFWKQKHSKKE